MIRTSLLIASSVLALTACQPASEAPQDTIVAEAPPVVSEDTVVEEVEAAVAEPEATVEVAANSEAAVAEEDHDHAHEDDDDHDAEHKDDHDHDEAHADEDGHDHGDAHDHGDDHDHDHAGGEAHVHGLSDLAVSLDGASVSVSLEGALANFDLDESLRTVEDPAPYTDGIVELIGGDCTRDQAGVSIRPIGDHGNMMIDMTYSCAAIDSLEAIDVTGFVNFSGFEEVNAVVLTEAGQTAKTLTSSETRLDLR